MFQQLQEKEYINQKQKLYLIGPNPRASKILLTSQNSQRPSGMDSSLGGPQRLPHCVGLWQ